MKYLIILLTINIAHALTPTERLSLIDIPDNSGKSQNIIARLMARCGSVGNSAFYYDELIKPENESFLTCFESRKAAHDQKLVDREIKKKGRKDIDTFIRNYDCSSIVHNFMKAICRRYK